MSRGLKHTLGNVELLAKLVKGPDNFIVGERVMVQTVTFYWCGEIAAVRDGWLILADAVWIANTGKLSKALESGVLALWEPAGSPVRINLERAVVAVLPWPHVGMPKTE